MWNMTNGTPSVKTQKLQEFIVLHSTILFESYTFRRSSFEGLNQPNEIEPIHFKQNLQLSRVKRIVLDYSFSFSWSLRFSPSSCSSSLMVSDGTSRSWVGSSTMVSCISLWVLFGVIRTPQLVDRALPKLSYHVTHPKLLERLKCESQIKNNERNCGTFLCLQHFGGKKGVLEF